MLRIVSGAQTGVDRGALDAALDCEVSCGGWCPKGRKAEDGTIPMVYPVQEIGSPEYNARTLRNVIDSNGTVIIYFGYLSGGTERTLEYCLKENRPYLLLDAIEVSPDRAGERIAEFVSNLDGETINVAGPRSSTVPQAQNYAKNAITSFIRKYTRK